MAGAILTEHEPGGDRHLIARLEHWSVAATKPIAFLGVIGMLIVSGITMADVLARWLANSGIVGLNEIVEMTFAVTVTACLPAGLAQRVNLKVDLLEGFLAGRWQAWAVVLGEILLFVFFVCLAWGVLGYARELESGTRATIIFRWPMAPFFYATWALLVAGAAVQGIIIANTLRRALVDPSIRAQRSTKVVKAYLVLMGIVVAGLIAAVLGDFTGVAAAARENPGWTVVIAGILLWASLLALVPLAAVLGMTGFVGTALFIGFAPTFGVFATEAAGFLTNINVAVLPLFLMMGSFCVVAGVSDDLYRLAQAVLGSFRGGLALATIAGCAGFGTVTGSSLATMATFGRIALPEMRARGYSPALATGSVAAGGNLGALVPPSGPLILFALLTEASIGQLFIAAILPGLMAFAFYSVAVMAYARIVPGSVPPPVRTRGTEMLGALRQSGVVVSMFVVVMGGIYTGIFTATEAAAVGAFSAFLLALARRKLRPATFWQVMSDTTVTTALIYTLIFGALMFSFFVEVAGLPAMLTEFIEGLNFSPVIIIVIILALFIVLGCVMDSFAILVITVPIATPVIVHLGYDIVWWGIINLAVVELGTLTPPFGTSCFILRSFARDVPITTIFKGVLVFCVADVVKIALLALIPAISLWLPSTMFN